MKRNILFVRVGEVGGGKTQSRIFINKLTRRGYDVSVLTMGNENSAQANESKGVKYYKVGSFQENRRGTLKLMEIIKYLTVEIFNPFVFLFTVYIILRNRIQTVIIPTYRQISLSPLIASRILNRKTIVTTHTHELICSYSSIMPFCRGIRNGQCGSCMSQLHKLPKNIGSLGSLLTSSYNFITSLIIFLKLQMTNIFADRIIFPSEDSRSFHERYGVWSFKAGTIPPFNDVLEPTQESLKRLKKEFVRNNRRIVLYVGRIEREKGIDVLLKGLKQLMKSRSSWRALIIGEGKDIGRMKLLTRKLGIGKFVKFLGFVPLSDLPAYYSISDIVVIPSLFPETYSIVLTEASLAKKITISSRKGALEERVRDGENGFLFEPGSPEELAEKIDYVIGNFKRLKHVGERAYADVKSKYDPDRSFSRYQEIIGR